MMDYLVMEYMENWGQYKRMIIVHHWCISAFLYYHLKGQTFFFFVIIMTQSQMLTHGEELRNGEGMRKRLKISVAHFDNSALIKTYSKTLIGRCMNPEEQEMKALFTNLPKIWKLEERVTGSDLGFGKFQFDFKTEEELEVVLKQQPYHFDYWMLALARWQPKQSKSFPSEIMFWIRVIGVPLEFRTIPTFESIGGALGRVVAVDVKHNRVQVVLDAFKELCLETTVDFKGGEFYDGEEVVVSLRYEKLFGHCKLCASLCHKEELCPLDEKNSKLSPERRRVIRECNRAWFDGVKHEERARSYKGVVINGQAREQNKERDTREYYGKGKGKAVDAVESKWVKVAERGSRKPPTHHGNYRGDGEGFRYKTTRRDEGRSGAPGGGVGDQEARIRTSVDRPREDQRQRTITPEAREEGEIKSAGDEVVTTATAEFQLELAKTQAEGSEVIMEATEEEMGLLKLQGLMEKQDSMAEDIDMELEAINATILESGVELETEEEFQTLSDEEAEKVLEVNGVQGHTEEEEEMVSGEVNNNKDTATGNMATRQSNRKRLFKPTVSIAGSTKMRMASALLSPRKKAVAKMGTRQGSGIFGSESSVRAVVYHYMGDVFSARIINRKRLWEAVFKEMECERHILEAGMDP
ncbi:hypothetical protein BRARA_B02184 [Brassica rapa]|uniref:DUF4283 domain-containing protein n=1 Tax=Brassica campestris TaxID=3711 RepID=A0A398AIR8_BRACM|nr:hypothetical protein BRARA_B02184 [Brassica rapa]